MHLSAVRLKNLGPFDDLVLRLGPPGGPPRQLTVVFGGDGMGKTTLLAAIAATRPGHSLPPMPARRPEGGASFVVSEWMLGDDDPARPHTLRVASPNARPEDEDENESVVRRREQVHFDRLAQERGGFVLVPFSGARWFSRSSVLLGTPERNLVRWDVRAASSFDDATRADLSRETKQVLAYAAIASSLAKGEEAERFAALAQSLREVCAVLLEPFGVTWEGASPTTLEPAFTREGEPATFEDLPKGARHLTAIGALVTRALFGAYESPIAPRDREGVGLVDDSELQQDQTIQRRLPSLLVAALPRVQWILTTASPVVAAGCEPDQLVALRRMAASQSVELHEGPLALIH
jgi:hypothetical protein